MTIARERLPFVSVVPAMEVPKPIFPMRYNVMVYKGVIPFWGYIVTHLSAQEYCDMNGYKLGQVYPGSRFAMADEKTDLF